MSERRTRYPKIEGTTEAGVILHDAELGVAYFVKPHTTRYRRGGRRYEYAVAQPNGQGGYRRTFFTDTFMHGGSPRAEFIKTLGASIETFVQALHPATVYRHLTSDRYSTAVRLCGAPCGEYTHNMLDVTCPDCRNVAIRMLTDEGRALHAIARDDTVRKR